MPDSTPGNDAGPDGNAPTRTLHATCIHWLGKGLLLLGPSGSGKSDLALRLIDERGATLVADDLVVLERRGACLFGRAMRLPGLIELRGHGIFRLAHREETEIHHCLKLGPMAGAERLPPPRRMALLGVELPLTRCDPAIPSTPALLRTILTTERVG